VIAGNNLIKKAIRKDGLFCVPWMISSLDPFRDFVTQHSLRTFSNERYLNPILYGARG
jgi:hypothetical protein